ncbi:hypothetical protein [Salinarimonas sp.]|uniref:hypothetical protein n=1 Tax=Salinarimonas sp. TaxID=2766526 RepID=UPI0032D94D93
MPTSLPVPPDSALALWLAANGLDADLVRAVLATAVPLAQPGRAADEPEPAPLSPALVRRWCAEAFGAAWPALSETVRRTCADVAVVLDDGPGARPQIHDHGPDAAPTIKVPWRRGDARDALALAHELAHAVQIIASHARTPGAAMPPVAREVCAFLGERALLAHLRDRSEGCALRTAHVAEDGVYLGEDAATLGAAFADPQAGYDYRWNYPVARWLARRARELSDPGEAAALLSSGPDAPARLRPLIHAALAAQNPLPPVLARDEPGPLVAYRQIGVAAALETARGEESEPETVEAFYEALLDGLRESRLAIGLDEEARPFGWAVAGRDGEGRPQAARLAAPFGDPAAMEALAARRLEAAPAAGSAP